MQITVNDVRNRLFRLFSPVINTPEFHEKYLSFSTLTDLQKRYDICEENWGLTMAYIHAIALHRNAPLCCKPIAVRSVHPASGTGRGGVPCRSIRF